MVSSHYKGPDGWCCGAESGAYTNPGPSFPYYEAWVGPGDRRAITAAAPWVGVLEISNIECPVLCADDPPMS